MTLSEQPPSRPAMPAAERDLTGAEFDALSELLAGIPQPLEPFALDEADGFAAGIAVQPAAVAADEWLRLVFDARGMRWGEADPSPEQRRAGELLLRREAAIRRSLAEMGGFDPWLADSGDAEDPVAAMLAPWVGGFLSALELFPLPELPGAESASFALPALERYTRAPIENPPPGLDAAIGEVVGCVAALYDVSERQRYRVEPAQRSAPKVGRNEPCPCGSGRKFKQCHGAAA